MDMVTSKSQEPSYAQSSQYSDGGPTWKCRLLVLADHQVEITARSHRTVRPDLYTTGC